MTTQKVYPLLLLVEDDQLLQSVLEVALIEEGFEIITASDGSTAIAELEAKERGQFAAVITDLRLGKGPTGWDVGRRGRETIAGVPVIYMSGDSAADWETECVPNGVMLQKPFGIPQLVASLTALLAENTFSRSGESSSATAPIVSLLSRAMASIPSTLGSSNAEPAQG